MKKILIFCCVVFFSGTISAEDNSAKLGHVLNQISSVKTDIINKKREQNSVQNQLNNLKKKIDLLSSNLKKTAKKLKSQKQSLSKLAKDQMDQQARLKDAREKFGSQINLANQELQPSYLKVLLHGQSKISPALILIYHQYVLMARLDEMDSIKKTLGRLEKNRREIKKQSLRLENLEKKQEEQKSDLEATKKERQKILDSLKSKIAEQNKRLKQLLAAKRNLEKLVGTLTQHKFTMSQEMKTRFCRTFIWPTKGQIITHFGSPIEQSSWKWNGVVIAAGLNQEVRAVAAGKVVYADWLNGYGLLLIIDHGSGYMSLYGHNSNFRKKLNDQVTAGEVIAAVGKSDRENCALYFAIRYNGKPMDPESWCS